MKNIFSVLLILGTLLFVGTPSVLADTATFLASSRVELQSPVPLPTGVTALVIGRGAFPAPLETRHFGSGHPLFLLPATDIESAFRVNIDFQLIGGEAGPEFGEESILQFATSRELLFTNNTNRVATLRLTYTFGTDLFTMATGGGQANAKFEFRILDPSGFSTEIVSRSFSVHSPGPNSFISFQNGREMFDFSILPFSSRGLAIQGSQTGLAAVPEPTSTLLLATGLAAVTIKTRKRF